MEKGLIEKERNLSDQRVVYVKLTLQIRPLLSSMDDNFRD